MTKSFLLHLTNPALLHGLERSSALVDKNAICVRYYSYRCMGGLDVAELSAEAQVSACGTCM